MSAATSTLNPYVPSVRLRWAERATSKPWTLQASLRIDRALIACEEFGVRS